MKRYPLYDPPEYLDWRPDADAMREFAKTLAADAQRQARIRTLTPERLRALYAGLLRFRLHDIALKRWVRQGVISKAWLGTGEEAVTVGCVHALRPGDLVGPMIRNAGACHEMGMPVADMLRAYLATADQITQGRDVHTGAPAHGIVPPISFVGSLVPVMAGMALAARLRGEPRVALTWVGDGASRTAEFHEGLNLAAVRRVPLIVVLQDNGVALGTRRDGHTRGDFTRLAAAYGLPGLVCDGNNVLDVWAAASAAVEQCRAGDGPVILLAGTFRMGGHATHDEAEGRALFPAELFAHWGRRDPIGCFETWLEALPEPLAPSAATPPGGRQARRPTTATTAENRLALAQIEEQVRAEVEQAAAEALASRAAAPPDPAGLERGVWATGGAADQEPAFPPLVLSATAAD